MNKSEIKPFIKQVVKNNKDLRSFTLRNNDVVKFDSVNSFGLRILELIEDIDVVGLIIVSVKRKKYFGQRMSLESALSYNDIESLDLEVIRQSKIDEHKQKMNNDFSYAMANSGCSLD